MRRRTLTILIALAIHLLPAGSAVAGPHPAFSGTLTALAMPEGIALAAGPAWTEDLAAASFGIEAMANDGSCGGAGQIPCMSWSWCAWRGLFNECWGGLVLEQPNNGCDSSRLNNWGLVCVACGGTGQPTCGIGAACDPRHNAFGLCYKCGGSGEPICWDGGECDEGYRNVFGFCSYSGFSNEPGTNTTATSVTQPGTEPVRGIADVHTHQFSNLGFGGVVFWGAPFDWGGINDALPWCDYTWNFSTTSLFNTALPPVFTFGYEVHGPKEFQFGGNPISVAMEEGMHNVGGTGAFDGWPKYNTVSHQQMYHKWLERAYLGGLRLMVMHAVSNEALCKASKRRTGWSCNDMEAVDRQIQAAKDLEWSLDYIDNNRIDQSGWYRIAYSPAQARQIIRDGKLAVVLGIEVDSLFNCKPGSNCSDAYLESQLQRYYSMGVRHVYPIHQFDNAFGGASIFRNTLNTGNAAVTGSHFLARNCQPEGYNFNITPDTFIEVFGLLLGVLPTDQAVYDALAADCNARGLTPTGQLLIEKMMAKKFIIDTDHMSRLMVDEVFDMAKAHEPVAYPLISGHTSFRDLDTNKTEFSVTGAQMVDFKAIGGMVSVPIPRTACGGTRNYAAGYRYAVNLMKKSETDAFPGIAFSTDLNGFAHATAPRFGLEGCAAEDPSTALQYPFTGMFGGSFSRQVTGSRTFDFNTQGLAHVGLIPDLVADLKKVGMTEAELAPLYNSAESYIRMWERIDSSDKTPPPIVAADIQGTRLGNGWYTSDVTVTWNISDGTAASGCVNQVIAADTAGLTLTCRATNEGGATDSSITIKRDTTPPVLLAATQLTPRNAAGWNTSDVTVMFIVTDALSGLANFPFFSTVTVTAEGNNLEASREFTDHAGNRAILRLGGIKIDKTPPTLGFRFAHLPDTASAAQIAAEQARWHNGPVTLNVAATDGTFGSGIAAVTPPTIVLSAEGVLNRGTATATDVAGNSVTVSSDPVKIDLTDPTITLLLRLPAANAHGWNNAAVTALWKCGDALSGPAEPQVNESIETEGGSHVLTGTCLDNAGNSVTHDVSGVRIDLTAPVVTAGAAPMANAAGWNNTDVTLTFTATDPLSGVDGDTTQLVMLTTDGIGLGATRTFTDRAGNSASRSLTGLKLDKTAPSIALLSRQPAANGFGWNNAAVTTRWTCGDTLSGPVAPEISLVAAAEGAGQSLTGVCGDIAGNAASDVVSGINIDLTAPVVTAAFSPVANAAGWHNTDVTLTFGATDALSGIVGSPSQVILLNTDGANQGGSATFGDRAGNSASQSIAGINLDKTAPLMSCVASPGTLWPANNRLRSVSVAMDFTDALSGTGLFSLTNVGSNEPGSNDITGFVVGGSSLTGELRAQRAGGGSGRTYTLGYLGHDLAGNPATCSTTVNVPHDRR